MPDPNSPRSNVVPLANRLLTNVAMPIVAWIPIFLGVLLIGLFTLLLQPGAKLEGGGFLAPWACALVGSLGIFAGCSYIVVWQRERERLRRWEESIGSQPGA